MDYKSNPDDLRPKRKPTRLDPKKKVIVKALLKDGVPQREIQRQTGVARTTLTGVKNEMIENKEFEIGAWKKKTSLAISEFVNKGSNRLLSEIDSIPVGQLPLAIAIMTDKVLALQDAPTVVVEHRLKVSHNDINALIKGEIIDLPNVTPTDPQPPSDNKT